MRGASLHTLLARPHLPPHPMHTTFVSTPPCPVLLASGTLHLAPCSLPLAHCSLLLAPCTLHLAPCPLLLAPCPLRIAPCPVPLAPCPLLLAPFPLLPPPCSVLLAHCALHPAPHTLRLDRLLCVGAYHAKLDLYWYSNTSLTGPPTTGFCRPVVHPLHRTIAVAVYRAGEQKDGGIKRACG